MGTRDHPWGALGAPAAGAREWRGARCQHSFEERRTWPDRRPSRSTPTSAQTRS